MRTIVSGVLGKSNWECAKVLEDPVSSLCGVYELYRIFGSISASGRNKIQRCMMVCLKLCECDGICV
jgi:hypothetical protein